MASVGSSWRAEREAKEEEEVCVRVGWCPASAISFSSVRLILLSSVSGTFMFPPSFSSAKRVKPPFFLPLLLVLVLMGLTICR